MSVEARDRKIEIWYKRVKDGEIKLPRFQRLEAWDTSRISSLLNTIVHNLPLGITLLLEVDQEKFISRYVATAEFIQPPFPRVIEHLLDGQQRLTALWRAFHNNYPDHKYFLYLKDYDQTIKENDLKDDGDELGGSQSIVCQGRWMGKRSGKLMPIWADDPEDCLKRGCVPFDLLKPEDISKEIDEWIKIALAYKKPKASIPDFELKLEEFNEEKGRLEKIINSYRQTIQHYNLPFLSLPSSTPKDVALNVFINMNTNSKPLSQYDIIVAEIEGVKDTSLHELQNHLDKKFPAIKRYFDLSFLILNTSALIQEKVPNRVGIWDMDKKQLVDNWNLMSSGLQRMATFFESQNIFDLNRLPTNAVLSVIAALYTHIPEKGDAAGKAQILLKKYLWSSFFTDRYENSAASRAYADYIPLMGILTGRNKPNSNQKYTEQDVPVFNRSQFPLATEEQLIGVTWPKNVSIRGRGILAVANYFGALDFADNSVLSENNVGKREYHHIFPDALIEEAKEYYPELNSTVALNCALITDKTNRTIGRKDPLTYLKDRYEWANATIVTQRLYSHLIPMNELAVGSYDNLEGEAKCKKIKDDYERFLLRRAFLIRKAVDRMVDGEEVTAQELIAIKQ